MGEALGLPGIAGPFVFSAAGLALAAVLLIVGLRPDPLQLASRLRLEAAAAAPDAASPQERGLALTGHGVVTTKPVPAKPVTVQPVTAGPRRRQPLRKGLSAVRAAPRAVLALLAIVGAHAVMAAVMSMTPLHLQLLMEGPLTANEGGHAHTASTEVFVLIGFTISLHIAGMYALSPVMGWLTDRAGRVRTIVLGHAVLLTAVCCAGLGSSQSVLVTIGLVLLGLGWSAATIAGSTLLAESVPDADRVLVQGVSDTLMGAAGAVGAGFSGPVMSWIGYQGLNLVAALIAGAVLTTAFLFRPRRRAHQSAPD
ncbi:MFS transporter [Pseudarthrobacter sp. N5]|uniref:MFS transporter n=1 Tax=Pseudarthrobacter sp. N5 TaxID=3418416 RepID=UPI003CEC458A